MSALELVDKLRRLSVVLSAADDLLVWDAPKGAVTPDLLIAMRQHKAELLMLLAVPPIPTVDPDVLAVVRCNWPECNEPVRLVQLHDGTEEQWCSSSHAQAWEPTTVFPEPSGPPAMAPTDDTGEQRVRDCLERGKPLLPCRVCQRDVWEESAPGVWRCQRCGTGERKRSKACAELLAWGEAHQWPRLPLAEGTAIPGGEWRWRGTIRDASALSLAAIAAAIDSQQTQGGDNQ